MTREKNLHAYLDGELDAEASLELEREMAQNPALAASYERLRALSAAVRDKADYHAAPARFKRPAREKPRPWFILAPAFASLAALAFAAGLFVARPSQDDRLGSEAVASHVRSTLASRAIDVVSSDQHTVKPWLSARLPFSPPVADLSGEGFELAGARVDYLGGRPVAVLVYKRRQHRIDAYVWPGTDDSGKAVRAHDGFNVEHFARDGMRYWLVSDLNAAELAELARLLRAR